MEGYDQLFCWYLCCHAGNMLYGIEEMGRALGRSHQSVNLRLSFDFIVASPLRRIYNMSRGGRGGFRGGGGGPQSGAMQLVSFDLLKDLGSGNLFNVQTALFPVSCDHRTNYETFIRPKHDWI